MRRFERRALTEGEIAIGRSIYGDEIAWKRVRLIQTPPLGFGAMAPFRHVIFFSRVRAPCDFAQASAPLQGLLVHEMAHLWQAARGVVLPFAKCGALGRGAYRYRAQPHARLAHYNIESQAEIARHLFHARRGVCDLQTPHLAWLEHVWATRLRRV